MKSCLIIIFMVLIAIDAITITHFGLRMGGDSKVAGEDITVSPIIGDDTFYKYNFHRQFLTISGITVFGPEGGVVKLIQGGSNKNFVDLTLSRDKSGVRTYHVDIFGLT